MNKKILVALLGLLLLSGCKKNSELVEPYKMTDHNIETMNSATEQGVYEINSSKKQLIIYHGIDNGIKTMSYSIKNNMLTIFFETEQIDQTKDFAFRIKSTASYNSIQILLDGKEEAFNTIYVD